MQVADGQRAGPGRLIEREDVDPRIPRQSGGVDHEKEAPRLVVQVTGLAVDRLARGLADSVEAVLHDVALLLREDTAELDRPDLRDRLDAKVVRRDRGADEARRGRLEGDVTGLDAPQHLVLQTLVPHLQIVVGVELALTVEVDIDVQPPPHDTGRADRVLRIGTDRRESRGAPRQCELPVLRRAAQVAKLIGLELEAHVELHAEVGVGAEQPALARGLERRRRGGGGRRRRLGDGRGRCGCQRPRRQTGIARREQRVGPRGGDERGRHA